MVDVCGRVCEAGAVVVEGVDGGVVLGVERGAAGLGGVVPPQEGETVHVQLPGPGLVPEVTNILIYKNIFVTLLPPRLGAAAVPLSSKEAGEEREQVGEGVVPHLHQAWGECRVCISAEHFRAVCL